MKGQMNAAVNVTDQQRHRILWLGRVRSIDSRGPLKLGLGLHCHALPPINLTKQKVVGAGLRGQGNRLFELTLRVGQPSLLLI